MEISLALYNLSPDPIAEWQRMLRFTGVDKRLRAAMAPSVETLLSRSTELVINTYDYLRSVPETAAVLGWEQKVDESHLEERRRFFAIWVARTLGIDTSDEFAAYLFRAGKFHAGNGPRHIHTPPQYVTASIGMVLSAFAGYLAEAKLSADVIAAAMGGWSRYLSVQLNQMQMGYAVAQAYNRGAAPVHVAFFGRLRDLVGAPDIIMRIDQGECVGDLLRRFFDYYPHIRKEALDVVWESQEKADSLWMEVQPSYLPKNGWRVLVNGNDVKYSQGFNTPVAEKDEVSIFPPGR